MNTQQLLSLPQRKLRVEKEVRRTDRGVPCFAGLRSCLLEIDVRLMLLSPQRKSRVEDVKRPPLVDSHTYSQIR